MSYAARPLAALPVRALRAVAALALLAVGRDAHAQVDLVLRDADVPAITALLRADIARSQAMHGSLAGIKGEVESQLATVSRNAEDPLGYVKARTARFVVPPDARYDAGCSRAVSAYLMIPTAVFTIGTADDATAAELQKKDPKQLSNKEIFGLMMSQAKGSAGQAMEATTKWYRARGFRISGTVASSAPLHWGGQTSDPLAVGVHMLNVAAGYGEVCSRLGNTATLTLAIDEKSALEPSAASAKSAALTRKTGDDFDATLARVGVTQDRYAAMLGALWQAMKEVQDPGEAEQSDAMARIPGMEAMAKARRQNRAWMQRHRDDVLPLVEAQARAMSGSRD
jgi:hypothetical protein